MKNRYTIIFLFWIGTMLVFSLVPTVSKGQTAPSTAYTLKAGGSDLVLKGPNSSYLGDCIANCGCAGTPCTDIISCYNQAVTFYEYGFEGVTPTSLSAWPQSPNQLPGNNSATLTVTAGVAGSVKKTNYSKRQQQYQRTSSECRFMSFGIGEVTLYAVTFTTVADLAKSATTLPSVICSDASSIDLYTYTNKTSGVTFKDGSTTITNTFNPKTATAGSHTITATYTFANGTTTITLGGIKVSTVPTVSSTLPTQVCADAADLKLDDYFDDNGTSHSYSCVSGTCGGSMFYTSGGSTYFDPSFIGTGTSYNSMIRMTSLNSDGCATVIDKTIVVGRAFTLDAGTDFSICKNGTATALGGTNSASVTGSWSGTGVTGSNFVPTDASISAGSTYTLTYTVDNTEGCVKTDTKIATVNAFPSLSATTTANTYCSNVASVNLNTAYGPKDGSTSVTTVTWSSTNTTVNSAINNTAKTVTISSLSGTYPLTFTYTNAKSCSNSLTLANALVINPTPSAPSLSTSPASPACGATSFLLSATGAGTNQEYRWYNSASVFQASGNSYSTGTLSVGGPYVYKGSIRNTVTGCEGTTSSISLTVNNLPSISAPTSGQNFALCTGTGTVDLNTLISPNPSGGTFSSTNSTISGKLSGTNSATLTITGVAAGTYPLRYTYTSGCTAYVDVSLVFSTGVTTPAVVDKVLCEPGQTTTLEVTNIDNTATYRWYSSLSAPPVSTGTIFTTPVLNATATYYVEAVKGSCVSNKDQSTVTVVDIGDVNSGPDLAYCNNSVSVTLNDASFGVSPSGGVFSGTGVTGTTFSGSGLALNSAYTVTYTVTQNGCSKSDTRTITLGFAPVLTIEPNDTVDMGELVVIKHNYPDALTSEWDFGDGWTLDQINGAHYYFSSGKKTVKLYIEIQQGAQTCSSTFTFSDLIMVSGDDVGIITGLDDPKKAVQDVLAYPIPFDNSLTVKSELPVGESKVKLISTTGSILLLKDKNITAGETEIIDPYESNAIPSGVYLLQIQSEKGTKTIKVLKK